MVVPCLAVHSPTDMCSTYRRCSPLRVRSPVPVVRPYSSSHAPVHLEKLVLISSPSVVPTLLKSRVVKRIYNHRGQREWVALLAGWPQRAKFSWRTSIFTYVVSGLSAEQPYARARLSSTLKRSEFAVCVYDVCFTVNFWNVSNTAPPLSSKYWIFLALAVALMYLLQ